MLTIRLSKSGKRNAISYSIVVSQTKSKRNGKALEVLGHFNPNVKPFEFVYDEKKLADWTAKGAQMSDAVKNLVAGTYVYTKYEPKKK